MTAPYRTALDLAAAGVPVLPLRAGKLPMGNCPACANNACGGRPNMKTPGPCTCPAPCHGWAAATADTGVIASPTWATAWQGARAVAYHPGGAGLTVVDLDDDAAISWARASLPRTVVVATTRGQHWLYRGTMPSANGVRPGVDIKSRMAYARWPSPGPGTPPGLLARTAGLPDAVRALAAKKPAAARPVIAAPVPAGGGPCPHRTPAYLERGVTMAEQRITEATCVIHTTVYRTFLAVLSVHGRCGCLTDTHVARLFAAAQAKGESARHCADAWANARARLGV
ncbi:bifunctional DNA primase/polymerase [Streptomyces paromomycinus]|uniref:DNA primase n=1 Tax=Streptomyces paromomycinus TaxID=92743 RepID=A0A401W8R5_STREY|nr:bifunctional DNA primase/polymerase [Streptomyces paromomycinus]GCD45702.1 DNA primase [Streptomyces paromomycinus]